MISKLRFIFNDRRALEDSLLVWIGAIFLIIAVYVFVYVPGVLMMFGNKGLFLTDDPSFLSSNSKSIETVQSFIGFLDSETIFNGKKILIKELVSKDPGNQEPFLKFRDLARDFFRENNVEINFDSAWIRIYEKEEAISSELGNNKFVDYEVSFGKAETRPGYMQGSQVTGFCDPESEDSILFFVFSDNRKIALCLGGVKK